LVNKHEKATTAPKRVKDAQLREWTFGMRREDKSGLLRERMDYKLLTYG